MKKVIVIFTQPVEENTSSMIRSRNILEKLPLCGYKTICYSPYSNKDEISLPNIDIRRYGKINHVAKIKEKINSSKNIKQKFLSFAYKLYKKIDIFGASIQYLKYIRNLRNEIRKEKPELLLTFSDPTTAHIIGKYCKKYAGKYIQQWGDPLAADIISKTALPVWIRKIIEKNLIKVADIICYVSPFTYEEQKKIYKTYANKMIFLPTPSIEYKQINHEKNKKLKVGYFGNYNLIARDIRPLYEAIIKNSNIELYLIGNSELNLQKRENITLIKRLSEKELDNYFYKMDILICLLNSKGNQVPGKMYHYAGSNKEILVIKDGEYGDEIERYFSQFDHYTFVPNDSKQISLALNKYIKEGVPTRKPVIEFSSINITKKLISNI